MKTATLREAQHHLSKLVEDVEKGEEIVLTRRGKPVIRLVPLERIDDPFQRKIDWAAVTREIDGELADLPAFEKNIVLEMREDERY